MKWVYLVLILALFLRIWPFWGVHLAGDADPYYHIRVASEVSEFDELSYGGRVHTYPPMFHWLLRVGHSITGSWFTAAKLIPVLLGVGTVFLVYLLGKQFYGERAGLFASAVLAFFPLHVQRTATFARPDCLLLFLMVLIPWLAYTKRYLWIPFAFGAMALTSFAWPYGLIVSVLLVTSLKLEKQERTKVTIGIGAGLFFAGAYWVPFFLKNSLPLLVQRASEQGVLSPSEMVMSFTFFAMVIAAGNLSFRSQKYFVPLWSIFGVSMLILGIRMLVYLSIPLALCMGLLYDEYLFKRFRFEDLGRFECLKGSIIAVTVASVLLAFALVSVYLVNGFGPEAEEEEFEAIYWIGENLKGVEVQTAWELGHYVTYFGAKSIQDGYFEYAPDPLGREREFKRMESYGADYLLMTKEDCRRIGDGCQDLWKADTLFKNDEAVVLKVK